MITPSSLCSIVMQYVWSARGLNSISIFDVYIKECRIAFFLQSESDWYLIDGLIAIWGRVCGQSVYIYKERGDIRKGWWGKCWGYFLLQSSASCHMSAGVHLVGFLYLQSSSSFLRCQMSFVRCLLGSTLSNFKSSIFLPQMYSTVCLTSYKTAISPVHQVSSPHSKTRSWKI